MKHYQKIYLLLLLLFAGRVEFSSAQIGDSCSTALPIPYVPGDTMEVSFNGNDVRWLSITADTPDVELVFSPEDNSDYANIERIELFSGNDCATKTLVSSQNYVDTDSIQVNSIIRFILQEAGVNYFLKVYKLSGYGDGFKMMVNTPALLVNCSPVCPNIINNPDFSIIDAQCVNWANTHQCPDPFNQGCVCAWHASHGTPNYGAGYPIMGVLGNDGEGIYQNLSSNVVAGRNYFLSFDYTSFTFTHSILKVQLGNANFNSGTCFSSIPGNEWEVPGTPVGNSGTWANISRCFTSNANYSTIRFFPVATSYFKEWMAVDNVTLIELDSPIPDRSITCSGYVTLSQPCPATDPRIHYLWSTGETTASITVGPTVSTTYVLTVSVVVNGQTLCSYDVTANVFVYPLQAPVLTIGNFDICQLNSTESYCFDTPGATFYNYTINPPNPFVSFGQCIDVTWNNLPTGCATINVYAVTAACTSATSSFEFCLRCQGNPSNLTFCDALASDILNDPQYASYITGGQIFKVPPGLWVAIHGTFTVDVPFSFDNSDVRFGPMAKVVVNPSKVFEVMNQCHLHSCDGVNMWESIWVTDPTAVVNIHDGNNLIEDGECAVRSENGGRFVINSTTFKNNLIGVAVFNYTAAVHQGKIYGCTFYGTGTLLNPHANYCTGYPQCGIRVLNVKYIQLGDPTLYSFYGRNIFHDLLSGIYCSTSNVDIYTAEFNNMIDPPGGTCTPPEGCGIYAYGSFDAFKVNVGNQTPSERCSFSACTYGIRERINTYGEIKGNTFTNCSTGIFNELCNNFNNLVKGNVFDDFERGIYFYNALNHLQYGLEIYENIFNSNLNSFNLSTYGNEAINVTNAISSSTNLWVIGNIINYSRVGIFARNVWEPCNIRNNTINFDILPSNILTVGVHHGIQCENDNGLEVDENAIVWRNQPSNPTGFINKMNGISINYSTNTNNISGGIYENKIGPYPAVNTGSTYGMGSGINISSECQGLTLFCNKMNRCEEGVTFNQANLGPQGYQDHSLNWYSNGNTFVYTPRQAGIYRVGGTVIQTVDWPYLNANESPNPHQQNVVNPLSATFSSYHCAPPAPFMADERDDIFGMLVTDDEPPLNPDYSGYEQQIKYAAKEKFYTSVKNDSTILYAGVPEDVDYEELFNDLENSNIAKIQDVKTSVDSLDYADASQKVAALIDTNFAEHNKKVVIGVYLETIANDNELDSAHKALLEPISLLHPLIGGEGVFWACAMLDKPVNTVLPPLRKANPNPSAYESGLHGLHVYPNPASDKLQIRYHSEVPLTLTIADVTGKIILNDKLDSELEIKDINTSMIESGTYFLKVMDGDEMVFTEKLVIIKKI